MFWIELPCGKYIDLHAVVMMGVRKTDPTNPRPTPSPSEYRARLAFVLVNGTEYIVECASVAEAQKLRHQIALMLTTSAEPGNMDPVVCASLMQTQLGLELTPITRRTASCFRYVLASIDYTPPQGMACMGCPITEPAPATP